jgi:type I restriction enzyme R subunit
VLPEFVQLYTMTPQGRSWLSGQASHAADGKFNINGQTIRDIQRAEDVAARLVRAQSTIEGNLQIWEFLRGLKTVFVAEEKRERNVQLLDPVHVEANSFHITEELVYQSGNRRIRIDLAFFVNGIPVIVVETKASTRLDGIARASWIRSAATTPTGRN